MKNLSKSARKIYLKLCYAGLREDMAQRIMFSILPHVADGSQVALTNGVVDVKALKAAVEGRTDVIRYGVLSILHELEFYKNQGQKAKPYTVMSILLERGDIETALDLAVKAFSDHGSWGDRFGGRSWEMIAKTLRQIVRLDNALSTIRQSDRNADNQIKEIQIMRDLVVELNIFDGLAHNSDTVMSKMVELETGDKNQDPSTLPHDRKENYRLIKRLMDAKELDNPNEVFKQIRDTLTDSGDINKFKEWVTQLRRKPEFFQTDPKRAEKLFLIYMRKSLVPLRGQINKLRDKISAKISELETKWSHNVLNALMTSLLFAQTEMSVVSNEFEGYKQNFFRQYPELDDSDGHQTIDTIISIPSTKIHKLKERVDVMTDGITSDPNMSDNDKLRVLGTCKEILSLFNHLSYLLDSI